ncbi:MAG: hypothetical protein MHMPM18_002477 [Marteilia pararefringens]
MAPLPSPQINLVRMAIVPSNHNSTFLYKKALRDLMERIAWRSIATLEFHYNPCLGEASASNRELADYLVREIKKRHQNYLKLSIRGSSTTIGNVPIDATTAPLMALKIDRKPHDSPNTHDNKLLLEANNKVRLDVFTSHMTMLQILNAIARFGWKLTA